MAKLNTNDIEAIKGFAINYSRKLIGQTLNGLDFINDLDVNGGVIRNLKDERSLNKVTIGAGVRQLNTDIVTAKHNRKWTARKLTPRYGMKIFSVVPDELLLTWQSEMMSAGAKREPFAKWLWQKEFEKVGQELNDNFYLASYAEDPVTFDGGATYTVGQLVYFNEVVYECVTNTSSGESPTTAPAKWKDVDNKVVFDGPGTVIANEITAGNITPVATGSFDHTNAIAAIQEVWGNVPEAHRAGGNDCYVSHSVYEDYIEDYNSRHGSGKGNSGNDLEEGAATYLKRSNKRCKIKPATWMGDSRRIIITKPGNIKVGTNQLSDLNGVKKVVETLHGYDSILKFMLTSNIADLEVLHVNDQV